MVERRNTLINAANKEPNQRTEAEKNAYNGFIQRFNEAINQVDNLDSSLKSQWQSSVWMAYHWRKHRFDFSTNDQITVQQYFQEYASRVFQPNNLVGSGFSQSGCEKYTYSYKFGERLHVGFTYGNDQKKASHFVQ